MEEISLQDALRQPINPPRKMVTVDERFVAPGGDDLTFGSLLSFMITRMFTRVETLDNEAPHRFYMECQNCSGTDMHRAKGRRLDVEEVRHTPDCLVAKHMPRLRAMATRGVT